MLRTIAVFFFSQLELPNSQSLKEEEHPVGNSRSSSTKEKLFSLDRPLSKINTFGCVNLRLLIAQKTFEFQLVTKRQRPELENNKIFACVRMRFLFRFFVFIQPHQACLWLYA